MKKVLLIDPKGWGMGINIGLGYIASALSDNGHGVKVLDLNNYRRNAVGRLQKALRDKPDYIGVSVVTSHSISGAVDVLRQCHEAMEGGPCIYVVGGIGATLAGKELFDKYFGLFDVLVKGEGEYSLLDILSGKPLPEIKGIVYSTNGWLTETQDRELMEDLAKLPFPKYELFDKFHPKVYDLMTSRGCIFNCCFCLNKIITHRQFRARSPENVVAEIEHVMATFGVNEFRVQDDNFTLDVGRAGKICDLIIKKRLHIKFHLGNGVRADRLTAELTGKLKMAGCMSAMIGIENGDAKTFGLVKKGETLDDIREGVRLLRDNGIKVKGTAIIGLMETTFDSDMRSVGFIQSLGIDSIWHHAYPYKGTELYEWAKVHGKFLNNGFDMPYGMGNLYPVTFETLEYSAEERERAFAIACIKTHQYVRLLPEFSLFRLSDIRRLFKVIGTVWEYDKWHLPEFACKFVVSLMKKMYVNHR